MKMENNTIYTRIDEQINKAAEEYKLSFDKLKYSIETFKPDSPKLEIVVVTKVGRKDKKTRYICSMLYFYSPQKYKYSSVAKLKSDIEVYLKQKKLKRF